MDRIIGIDYGRKRTGLAVSDPLKIFASALDTIHSTKIIEYLKNYADNETIVRFVVGYPKNLDNSPSEAAKDVDIFLKTLKKAFPDIPVTLEDERFTSVMAHRAMIDDKISAAIILQGFLDRNSSADKGVSGGISFVNVPIVFSANVSRKGRKKR